MWWGADFADDRRVAALCRRRLDAGGRTRAAVRCSAVGAEAADDADLDDKILMPTFVVCCGLCLTAIFLLGYEALA